MLEGSGTPAKPSVVGDRDEQAGTGPDEVPTEGRENALKAYQNAQGSPRGLDGFQTIARREVPNPLDHSVDKEKNRRQGNILSKGDQMNFVVEIYDPHGGVEQEHAVMNDRRASTHPSVGSEE